MHRFSIVFACIILIGLLAGCGSTTASSSLVVNQYTFPANAPSTVPAFTQQWLITDSNTLQQVQNALLALPTATGTCTSKAQSRYIYELVFHSNSGSQVTFGAIYHGPAGCDDIQVATDGLPEGATFAKTTDVRVASASFQHMLAQAIGLASLE
jgi:hypothetical protein